MWLINCISDLYVRFVLFFKIKSLPLGVVVAGGMGGQLLSIAIYNHLKDQGFLVFYDLRYFDRGPSSVMGGLSQWEWQLDLFNINLKDLPSKKITKLARFCLIRDSAFKFKLGLESISNTINTNLITPVDILEEEFQKLELGEYMSVHLRQGDYLSVASFVPDYEDYYHYIQIFADSINQLVIFSDGPIPKKLLKKIECLGIKVTLFSNGSSSPQLTHLIIQRSNISIISNSQFSLTAGIYSKACLMPTKWSANSKYNSILGKHISMGFLNKKINA
jgi:hypothetical protein